MKEERGGGREPWGIGKGSFCDSGRVAGVPSLTRSPGAWSSHGRSVGRLDWVRNPSSIWASPLKAIQENRPSEPQPHILLLDTCICRSSLSLVSKPGWGGGGESHLRDAVRMECGGPCPQRAAYAPMRVVLSRCHQLPRPQFSQAAAGARASRRGQQRPDQATSAESPVVEGTLRFSSHFSPYQDPCQEVGALKSLPRKQPTRAGPSPVLSRSEVILTSPHLGPTSRIFW